MLQVVLKLGPEPVSAPLARLGLDGLGTVLRWTLQLRGRRPLCRPQGLACAQPLGPTSTLQPPTLPGPAALGLRAVACCPRLKPAPPPAVAPQSLRLESPGQAPCA